jgi:uncharacterized alpha-E superfamily protein
MLFRIAVPLFWLARHIMRAEYSARILDLNLQALLAQSKRCRLRLDPLIIMVNYYLNPA